MGSLLIILLLVLFGLVPRPACAQYQLAFTTCAGGPSTGCSGGHNASWAYSSGGSVTNLHANDNNYVAWSRNGLQIAYASGGLIYRCQVSNCAGTVVQLSPSGDSTATSVDNAPDWSPDDNIIAFSHTIVINQSPLTFAAYLEVMSAVDGSGAHAILGNGTNNFQEPRFSPNGTTLVYATDLTKTAGNFQVWSCSVASCSTTQTQLTNISGVVFDPFWTPDGTHILVKFVFVSPGNVNVGIMTNAGTGLTALTSLVEPIESGQPSVSSDGTTIAYVVDDCTGLGSACYGQSDDHAPATVWLMNADGSNQRTTGLACAAISCSPVFNPSGVNSGSNGAQGSMW